MLAKDLSVNERIKFLIEVYLRLSQRAFSEAIGSKQSTISSLFSSRENRPGLDLLQKILAKYSEVSPEWLLMGEGEMLKSNLRILRPASQPNEHANYDAQPVQTEPTSQLTELLKRQVQEQQEQIAYLREQLSRTLGQTDALLRLVGTQLEQPTQGEK